MHVSRAGFGFGAGADVGSVQKQAVGICVPFIAGSFSIFACLLDLTWIAGP